MGNKPFKNLLLNISHQSSLSSNLSLDELIKAHNTLDDAEADRNNKTLIQRALTGLLVIQNISLFYLILSKGTQVLLFTNHPFLLSNGTLNVYIFGSAIITYWLLNIIMKYHFPDSPNCLERLLRIISHLRNRKNSISIQPNE